MYDDRVFEYDTAGNVIEKTDRQGRRAAPPPRRDRPTGERSGGREPANTITTELLKSGEAEVDQPTALPPMPTPTTTPGGS